MSDKWSEGPKMHKNVPRKQRDRIMPKSLKMPEFSSVLEHNLIRVGLGPKHSQLAVHCMSAPD